LAIKEKSFLENNPVKVSDYVYPYFSLNRGEVKISIWKDILKR
jgi:hypothetical protein